MEVNFFGTVNSINAVYDYYKSKKAGQISIVSSVAGYRGLPAAGAYCASKSALSSFAESLYFDLKRSNVRVSLVSPGFIKTPMTDQNDFPMPMIKSPEFAAEQMFKGLTKSKGFEIHFPKSFTTIMKVLKVLPNGLYFKILEKGMKRIKDSSLIKNTVSSPTLNPNLVSVARLIATFSSCLNIQSSNEILIFLFLKGTIKSYLNLKADPY